jgi:MFS family permease
VAYVLSPAPLTNIGGVNPLGWGAAGRQIDLILDAATLIGFVLAPTALASIVVRYRRSVGVERQQLRWLVAAVVVALAASAIVSLRDAFNIQSLNFLVDTVAVLGLAAAGFLPVAIAIAITRYGLYSLGRIVKRTVVYTIVAIALAIVYAAAILVVGSILPAEQDSVTVAATTLLVAALFNPLRKRVQRFVNKWFYRSTYDPESVLLDLGSDLQDTVDSESVAALWVEAVTKTLQPTAVGIWTRQSGQRP